MSKKDMNTIEIKPRALDIYALVDDAVVIGSITMEVARVNKQIKLEPDYKMKKTDYIVRSRYKHVLDDEFRSREVITVSTDGQKTKSEIVCRPIEQFALIVTNEDYFEIVKGILSIGISIEREDEIL